MRSLLQRAIAHRGLFDNKTAAENSLEAFSRAMSGSYPIELDVHLTADEKIVVFHDDSLARMTGVKKKISQCTWRELSTLKLLNTNCRIPTLAETLDFIDGQVPLLVEIKYDTPVGRLERPLLAMLQEYREKQGGRFCVQSFDPLRMGWFLKKAPLIPRGQLVPDFYRESLNFLKKEIFKHMWLTILSQPDFISASIEILDEPAILRQKHRGRFLFGWTAKNQKQFDRAAKVCDSVIFDQFIPRSRKL